MYGFTTVIGGLVFVVPAVAAVDDAASVSASICLFPFTVFYSQLIKPLFRTAQESRNQDQFRSVHT